MTPSSGFGRRRKVSRVQDEDADYDVYGEDEHEHEQLEDSEDEELPDYDDGRMDVADSNIDVARSPSPGDHSSLYEEAEGDTSLVVSEEYESPWRKKIVSPTKEHFQRGISDEDLRAQGWDDDYIVLVQKIAMRGYEPILSRFSKFTWRFMPDSLFAEGDDAFLGSLRGATFRNEKALERLFELGGRVRDRIVLESKFTPERQTRKMVKEYMKWVEKDSGLDHKTAIPLLVIEDGPVAVEPKDLQANARRKLQKVAARYRAAFRVNHSIEGSPVSRTSTVLAYPVPTLYAIIASGTGIALCAYRPDDDEPGVKMFAFLNMKDKAYDIWNSIAVAIIVCHARNVQLRIADETGLGAKSPDDVEEESDDPDA